MGRPAIDLTGQRFGYLTVIERAGSRRGKNARKSFYPLWRCLCDCGNEIIARGPGLKNGGTLSCGHLKKKMLANRFIDLTGQRFGELVVVERAEGKRRLNSPRADVLWSCKCSCDRMIVVKGSHLRGNITVSCGHLRNEILSHLRSVHGSAGHNRTAEYAAWTHMKGRCYNPNFPNYKNWGGRGIKVADRYRFGEGGKSGFECFFEDVGLRPTPQHSLDRWPDFNGDYAPGNVRWATKKEQGANRRKAGVLESFSTEELLQELERRREKETVVDRGGFDGLMPFLGFLDCSKDVAPMRGSA